MTVRFLSGAPKEASGIFMLEIDCQLTVNFVYSVIQSVYSVF